MALHRGPSGRVRADPASNVIAGCRGPNPDGAEQVAEVQGFFACTTSAEPPDARAGPRAPAGVPALRERAAPDLAGASAASRRRREDDRQTARSAGRGFPRSDQGVPSSRRDVSAREHGGQRRRGARLRHQLHLVPTGPRAPRVLAVADQDHPIDVALRVSSPIFRLGVLRGSRRRPADLHVDGSPASSAAVSVGAASGSTRRCDIRREPRRDAADQPAAADRDHHRVEDGRLLRELVGQRALARHDGRLVGAVRKVGPVSRRPRRTPRGIRVVALDDVHGRAVGGICRSSSPVRSTARRLGRVTERRRGVGDGDPKLPLEAASTPEVDLGRQHPVERSTAA